MDFPIHSITKSADETEKIGEALGISYITKGDIQMPRIILCSGDLGSGKTTFARGIARGLGIDTRLLSPTYIIVRRYSIPKISVNSFLYHLDLYRTNGSLDIEGIGIDEMFNDPYSITLIEWSDRLENVLINHPVLVVQFKTLGDDQHECLIEKKSSYGT